MSNISFHLFTGKNRLCLADIAIEDLREFGRGIRHCGTISKPHVSGLDEVLEPRSVR